MELYCISIFVDPNRMEELEKLFGMLDYPLSPTDGVENELKFHAFEVAINHIGLIFVESNNFHKHLDFEIGLVEFDRKVFLELKSEIDSIGLNTKWVEDGNAAFVLNSNSHGPFFFTNIDGYSVGKNLKGLLGAIAPSDFSNYQIVRENFFPENLKKAIRLENSDTGMFRIRSIEVLCKNEMVSDYKCEGLLKLSFRAESTMIEFM